LFKKNLYLFLIICQILIISGIACSSNSQSGKSEVNPESIKVFEIDLDLNNPNEEETFHFDIDSLQRMVSDLMPIGPINSIIISKNKELIVEQYFRGMSANRTHNIKSASKSILSILIGIAVDEGYIGSLDERIDQYFPEYFAQNPDSIKQSITIRDLLTMRGGLESTSGRSYGRWVMNSNWVNFKLNRPIVGTPGVDRIYSTGTTHLLSVILTKASGMSTLAFSNKYLFNPMNIQMGGWDRDPQGFYLGGNNMALKPLDMVKIGQLMMDVGKYENNQIVSRDWVIKSVIPLTGRLRDVNYGYLWFRKMSGDYHMVYAWGNGGQFIMILPEIQTVIAITSQNIISVPRSYRLELMRKLDNEIIPYVSQYNNLNAIN
jgi:CubicO group peptidase (beta-lactamase class C family)